jgi:hypothetical protein
MAARLGDVARVLRLLSGLFANPQPLVAIGPIRRAKAVIDGLTNDADALGAAARTDGWLGFDPFRLQRLEAQLRSLFPDVVSKGCLIVSGIAAAKRRLLRAADAVVAVAEAIAGFDRRSREVSDALPVMNEAMGELFGALGIASGPRQDMTDEVFETSTTAAENCDKIRARIALADTAELYRTKA